MRDPRAAQAPALLVAGLIAAIITVVLTVPMSTAPHWRVTNSSVWGGK